ncbi:hypothetical protein BB561_001759 [Smittium simulii]|uniref:Uncharacterized protein n=1 Tax=Smittium simulii TaxID=133385 RepID=A0A2T9YT71_9FUNG|nr:hypothetical protein BB561_001759 [Smittium simulii]
MSSQKQNERKGPNGAPLTPDKIPFSTLFQDLVDSVLIGGLNKGVLNTLNMIFMLLFFVTLVIMYATGPNIHLFVLLLLSLFVFFGLQGFIAHIQTKAPEAVKPINYSEVSAAAGTSSSSSQKPRTARKRL